MFESEDQILSYVDIPPPQTQQCCKEKSNAHGEATRLDSADPPAHSQHQGPDEWGSQTSSLVKSSDADPASI